MKLTNKQKAYAEHYVYGTLLSAGSIVFETLRSKGTHNYVDVLWALAAGLVVPALAKLNTKSIANKISNETGLPSSAIQSGLDAGVKKVDKTIADNASK